MSSGLIALLDDVVAITKLAAASLDDIGAAAGKAGSKAMGVVVDDAAVTPRYTTGFTPDRELPMIRRIALGSLRNKMLYILPVALLLSRFAPWAITPLLMLGGVYLCYEGAEKVAEPWLHPAQDTRSEGPESGDSRALENDRVAGAIRTDLILSAEIMAIALAEVAGQPILTQAIALSLVGIVITLAVYGAVGLIVKMDDIGLFLSRRHGAWVRGIGRGLVRGMPALMHGLALIGTAAMVWVGGGILIHGAATLGLTLPTTLIEAQAHTIARYAPWASGALSWIVTALAHGLAGLAFGMLSLLSSSLVGALRR